MIPLTNLLRKKDKSTEKRTKSFSGFSDIPAEFPKLFHATTDFLNHPLDIFGNTSLHMAVAHNDYPLTCLLLLKGASPNIMNKASVTPYGLATTLELENITSIMKKHLGKEDPSLMMSEEKIKQFHQSEALDISLLIQPSRDTFSTNKNAHEKENESKIAKSKSSEFKINRVIREDTYINFPTYQLPIYNAAFLGVLHDSRNSKDLNNFHSPFFQTPIMKASYSGMLEDVVYLVGQGADISVKDSKGFSALHWASLNGHLKVAEALVTAGAKVVHSDTINTPLLMAIYGNHIEIVNFLISKGALGKGKKNKKNHHLLIITMVLGHWEIFRILLDSGVELILDELDLTISKVFLRLNQTKKGMEIEGGADILYQKRGPWVEGKVIECCEKAKKILSYVIEEKKLKKKKTSSRSSVSLMESPKPPVAVNEIEEIEKSIPYASEAMTILSCAHEHGTELNKQFILIFEEYLKLLNAVNANSKILFVTITAKLIIQIGSIVNTIFYRTGLRSQLTSRMTMGVRNQEMSTPLLKNSYLYSMIAAMAKKLQSDHISELTVATRLSTGVWPPPDASKNLVQTSRDAILATARLIDMANATGLWHQLQEYLTIPALKSIAKKIQSEPAPEEMVIPLAKFDYVEYKRIIFLNKIQKIVGSDTNEMNKKNDEHVDSEFMKRLDILLKDFIRHVYTLKETTEKGNKEDYVFLSNGIVSKIDDLCNEVQNNDIYSETDYLMLSETISLSNEVKKQREILGIKGQAFLTASKIAAGAFPPVDSNEQLLMSIIEYVESVKQYITLIQENIPRLRKIRKEKEELSKKERWQRECLQNEKIKELFGYWEDSMNVEDPDEGEAPEEEEDQEVYSKEELGLLDDSRDGLVVVDHTTENKIPTVKGGKLIKLIEHLTSHYFIDSEFRKMFVMTHQSVCSTKDFLKMVFNRYEYLPPPGLNQKQFYMFVKKKVAPIRIQVLNVLHIWIDFSDINFDSDYYAIVDEFIQKKAVIDFPTLSNTMMKAISNKTHGKGRFAQIPLDPKLFPEPVLDSNSDVELTEKSVFVISPIEIARQLTLIDSEMFSKIPKTECLVHTWGAKLFEVSSTTPFSSSMIQMTTKITLWLAKTILESTTAKQRVGYLVYFVKLAIEFKSREESLSQEYEKLTQMMSPKGQYSNYRKILSQGGSMKSMIPFLGLFLTDLAFVEIGNSDVLPGSTMINMEKRRKVAQLILSIKQFQEKTYGFHKVQMIQDFFIKVLPTTVEKVTDQALLDMSYALEPPHID